MAKTPEISYVRKVWKRPLFSAENMTESNMGDGIKTLFERFVISKFKKIKLVCQTDNFAD